MFHIIKTPATGIITLRFREEINNQFRPAATGFYNDKILPVRVAMEKLEVDASAKQRPGYIASAASNDRVRAIKNAKCEAVERFSLSAWWSLKRPVITKVSDDYIQKLLKIYFNDKSFRLSIGYVESVCCTGYAAVSILESDNVFPFAVLGGAYDPNPYKASDRAFFESIQSWAASEWLQKNYPDQVPYWDVIELHKRSTEIQDTSSIKYHQNKFEEDKFSEFFKDKIIHISSYKQGYVVWVCFGDNNYRYSYELAEKVKHPGEKTIIFTQYNF
jgi:hypothetical protein